MSSDPILCSKTSNEDTPQFEEDLKSISRAIGQNAFVAGVACVILLSVVMVLYVAFQGVWDAVSAWLSSRSSVGSGVLQGVMQAAGLAAGGAKTPGDDDVVYKGSKRDASPKAPTGVSIKARLAQIKSLYAPYNKAITEYVAQTRDGALPDDLIDEKIMSREGDDFEYGKQE